jgi:hypothetical protein
MSKAASRLYHQATYGPLTAKTLQTILRRELMEQFGFEHMGLIADALIGRFLQIVDQFSPDHVRLAPGQVLWLAVAKDARGGPNKTMLATRLVPVRLTLVAPEDLDQIANHRKIPRELRPQVAARLLRQAADQGGVLSLPDLAVLLGVTYPTAAAAVHEYERRHHVVLPYRGVLHDLGPTTTHKVQAIELKLRGLLTREIARRIHHDPRSVDIYQNDFERVYELHAEGKSPRQISFLIKRSVRLVREYIRLIEAYVQAVGPDPAPSPPTKTPSKPPPDVRKPQGQSP